MAASHSERPSKCCHVDIDVVKGTKIFLVLFTVQILALIALWIVLLPVFWYCSLVVLLLLAVVVLCTVQAFCMQNPRLMWPFIVTSAIWLANWAIVLVIYGYLGVLLGHCFECNDRILHLSYEETRAIEQFYWATPQLLWLIVACIGVSAILMLLLAMWQLYVVVKCRSFFEDKLLQLQSGFFAIGKQPLPSTTPYKLSHPVQIDMNVLHHINLPCGHIFSLSIH